MNEVGATAEEGWTLTEMRPLAESIESILVRHFTADVEQGEKENQ